MVWFNPKFIIIGLLLLFFVWISIDLTEFQFEKFKNIPTMFHFIKDQFFPLNWSIMPRLIDASIVTLAMAFLGTFIALLIAIPLSFMSARNTSRHAALYTFNRSMLSGLRSIPEIVFGLIFVVSLGLGPFPAVLAIMLHNIGVLGKLISELIESAETGPQEAMKSVGATRWVAVLFSILPQIWPNVLSHFFYRFEVAIRTSLILGFIGAGGIGQQLFNHFQTFQYKSVATDILVIMILVIVVDFIGGKIRERVI
ncbi:phosphonate ABC transporter, permease protein PhnE [Anaerobacillus alkalidiazotrophicus]|uniref:Phosphonate ABC transporter, permease protein PhnE n=1 Tax=Anaerobacillus alkalidiazotrophicus TaxID=472963 RepID=A0A1S2M114_9BACI|nr:phosphonate ABC transporter, permease protein PhnE [Anaerobacillus alkalidiazotrophicus]OIJ18210.1 phosphonate ABC transporter, permease protein PhnE [Anaerobacillus alkalidiazotrophicus]OIJ19689.1 phosphonate ABC transporter, permease protein PhnE [Anaerobacillus alkalidiazotrophicus]